MPYPQWLYLHHLPHGPLMLFPCNGWPDFDPGPDQLPEVSMNRDMTNQFTIFGKIPGNKDKAGLAGFDIGGRYFVKI
jgi:hypothetical protein